MPSPRTALHPAAVLGLVLINGTAFAEPDAAAAPVPDSPAAVKELVGRLDGPDVRVLVPAGATTNPLDHLPFTRRLVVFDVSDPRQVTLARSLGSAGDELARIDWSRVNLDEWLAILAATGHYPTVESLNLASLTGAGSEYNVTGTPADAVERSSLRADGLDQGQIRQDAGQELWGITLPVLP